MLTPSLHNPLRRLFQAASPSLTGKAGVGLLLLIFSLSSCIRRPLEVYYRDKATLRLYVDWQSEFGAHYGLTDFRPTGMTVHIYDEFGDLYQAFSTNDVDSADLRLPVGQYKLVVFNKTLDSYGTFTFLEPERFSHFRTQGVTYTRRYYTSGAYQAPWDAGTRYTWEPKERIGAAVDSFEVTEQMVANQDIHFLHYYDRRDGSTYFNTIHEVVKPLQTMIHIYVHVNGIVNMKDLEASLSGMADGCSMAYTWRNPTECNIFFGRNDEYEYRDWYYDENNNRHGWVTIDIPTWGEPRGQELQETRDSMQNVLKMEFTLVNDSIAHWDFNVGHLIEYHDPQRDPAQLTPPDVLRHLYLVINREIPLLPDVPHENDTGAGFDAHVDPWEYGGEVDLGTF